ncbi:MAG TPA: cytochrome c3 family protein [Nitrospirota bacterium]|nr:cytochrome c3 family protein [Nitrospirota bacterium]
MHSRIFHVLLLFTVMLFFPGVPTDAQEKLKLKPGARGKICLECHVDFQDKMKSPSVHTPVKTGNCVGCHNPHTSWNGKLLYADASKICSRCHTVIPDRALSVHQVVANGKCVLCHDTHAAQFKNNLNKNGNELCFSCHKALGETIAKVKFKHTPVTKGCLTCHASHASAKAASLLRENVPALCTGCHNSTNPSFLKRHMNYPVGNARCTVCHNPHGSNTSGILYDTVHKPVANKMCSQCHLDPSSPKPFQTKKEGYELCTACHSTMMNETFGKKHLHWPVVSKQGCLSCHTPHAAPESSLLKGTKIKICGSCHADTVERSEQVKDKHAPVTEGKCNACHSPHSSNNSYLLKKPVVEQCGMCHDWVKHSSHPMGEKIRDYRNKNLSVQCLSCHSAHGTPYKKMLFFAEIQNTCVQCHEKFGR